MPAQKPFVWPVRVYYEDTDAGGVVYYANYLRFMERARTEWLRSLGAEPDALTADPGVLFVVAEVSIRYRQPGRFNEALNVTVENVRAGRSVLTLNQRIFRETTGDLLTEATVRAACVDAETLKPQRIPEQILGALS